jgi:hypothetical protein
LFLREVAIVSAAELARLREVLGAELDESATLRGWQRGEEVMPHSASVALEALLRTLTPDEEREVGDLLVELINRIAERFPREAAPL